MLGVKGKVNSKLLQNPEVVKRKVTVGTYSPMAINAKRVLNFVQHFVKLK